MRFRQLLVVGLVLVLTVTIVQVLRYELVHPAAEPNRTSWSGAWPPEHPLYRPAKLSGPDSTGTEMWVAGPDTFQVSVRRGRTTIRRFGTGPT